MNFRKLELADKSIIENYKTLSIKRNCDFCFSDLFLWKDYYETEIYIENDTLFLRYQIDNDYLYFIPLGNTLYGIQKLVQYTRLKHQKLKIINIEQQDLSLFNDSFILVHKRNNDDYIYSAEELSTLSGKKYKGKRNFVNQFQSHYVYEVKPIKEFDEEEDMSFLDLWAIENPEEDKHSFLGEKEAIHKALLHLNDLDMDGLILKVNSSVVGLTIGTYHYDTFITHFEKVEYKYSGASQMLNYLLANYVKDKVTYINREEDLGIEGLRKAKLSYHPIQLIESFTAYYKEDYPVYVEDENNIILKKEYNL